MSTAPRSSARRRCFVGADRTGVFVCTERHSDRARDLVLRWDAGSGSRLASSCAPGCAGRAGTEVWRPPHSPLREPHACPARVRAGEYVWGDADEPAADGRLVAVRDPGPAGETVVRVLLERDGRRILRSRDARGNHGLSATGDPARFVHRRRGLHASILGRAIRRRGSPNHESLTRTHLPRVQTEVVTGWCGYPSAYWCKRTFWTGQLGLTGTTSSRSTASTTPGSPTGDGPAGTPGAAWRCSTTCLVSRRADVA